jgi:hypothetical protein
VNEHPTLEQLRQWADGRLSEAASQAIEAHLETPCPICQPLLEGMTVGPSSLAVAAQGDGPGGPTAPPHPATRSLKN